MDAHILQALAAWKLRANRLGDEDSAFVDGFLAGFALGEETAWRLISDDPSSWPPDGQWVVLWDVVEETCAVIPWDPKRVATDFTHWAPITPPKRESMPPPKAA